MLMQHSEDQQPIISWMGSGLCDLLKRHQVTQLRIQSSMLNELTKLIDQQQNATMTTGFGQSNKVTK
ncbi:hypothetical protein IPC954_04565 [Pseudomonas aeruginosa]|nr:hypothetical protein AXW95_11725 [Pseudomonas aeruginosa]RMK28292.1 hypothetical protein IPC1258_07755 [Pseudomonas aeruginosa]RPT42113.1 hypothetical protein IPC976_02575 [Pseudomonas aeruginosa]RPT72359.1 hypothetical protein IPC948_11065 [Pseudomonas aeruginosa]RPT73907.1 hypothetical protein IPC954_04565 [Pseudomonas aeruginosa]